MFLDLQENAFWFSLKCDLFILEANEHSYV